MATPYFVLYAGWIRDLIPSVCSWAPLPQPDRANPGLSTPSRRIPAPTPLEGLRAKGSRLPLDEALAIAKQIADALEAAHEQGIVCRDLKPANIKVRADGMVKVLDVGLAKAIGR